MFWNGTRWIDEQAPAAPPPPSGRPARNWLATGVMIVGIAALVVPFAATSAASNFASSGTRDAQVILQGRHRTPTPSATPIATSAPGGPTISAVTASAISQTGARISWSLNEPATGQVEYGITSAYGSVTTAESSFKYSAHVQQVSGLVAGTQYHYRVTSRDSAGLRAVSPDATFTTLASTSPPTATPTPTAAPTAAPTATPTAAPTATPTAAPTAAPAPGGPTISAVTASAISQTGARISWSLSEPATGQVEYGVTSAYGRVTTAESSFTYSAHIQQVAGLVAGTAYHYRVESRDSAGQLSISPDATFTTLASTPTAAPTAAPTAVPTATPTAVPTATPTAAPTATPTAAPTATSTPGTRPFAAPVTTRTVAVPSSIAATGATDVSAALNAFVASVPDGSIITFPAGATYRLDQGIQFANRHNLVFVGNGATLKVGASASGADQLNSTFVLGHIYGSYWTSGTSDIAIRDFVLVGNSVSPGVFSSSTEHLASFVVEASTRVEISGIRSSGYPGDFVKIGDASASVWIHDNTVPTVGRNGVTIIAGRDVLAERNTFGVSGYCVFDIEPNVSTEATYNARFLTNVATTWGNAFFAAEGSHTGATIDGVTVSGNSVTNGSLLTVVDNGGTARMKNFIITNNTSGRSAGGPILRFAHIDGLTITGNVQPLSSGALTSITDSTGVTNR